MDMELAIRRFNLDKALQAAAEASNAGGGLEGEMEARLIGSAPYSDGQPGRMGYGGPAAGRPPIG